MKKLLLPAALLLLAAVLGVLYLSARRESAAAAARFETERQDLRKQVWEANKHAKEAEARLAAASAPAAPTTTAPAGRGQNRTDLAAMAGVFLNALNQPAIQGMINVQQRAQLDSRYATLFKQLNLSPEQLDKFKTLLVDRQSAGLDVLSAARAQGINPLSDPRGMQQLVTTAQAGIDNEIRGLIGDPGFEQYQTYNQTLPQRTVVSQLEQRLSYSQTPLTPGQSEQMVQILAANSPARADGAAAAAADLTVDAAPFVYGANGAGITAISNAANTARITTGAVNQAQGVLSASQLTALQQLQQEQQTQQAIGQNLRTTLPASSRGN